MSKVTGSIRHTHRYYQSFNKRNEVTWRCMLDGCTHFIPKNMHPLPLGLNSSCESCEKPFTLTHENMKEEKPICDTCMEKAIALEEYLKERGI
jgi:hypothetical protein